MLFFSINTSKCSKSVEKVLKDFGEMSWYSNFSFAFARRLNLNKGQPNNNKLPTALLFLYASIVHFSLFVDTVLIYLPVVVVFVELYLLKRLQIHITYIDNIYLSKTPVDEYSRTCQLVIIYSRTKHEGVHLFQIRTYTSSK